MTDATFRLPRPARQALTTLAAVVCPEAGQAGVALPDVVDHTERFLGSLAPLPRFAATVGLCWLEYSALFPAGARFSRLSTSAAEDHFARWWDNKTVRPLAETLAGLLGMSYYEQPAVQEQIGYLPDLWIERVTRDREATYGAAISDHQQTLRQRLQSNLAGPPSGEKGVVR
ncbi:MAG: hypothetical protein H6707_13395 [Deltaproteobacteria bacterium]|nr:hypothetical protein [Deltaproteobacteria bacterium]